MADAPNINALWSRVAMEEFTRLGLELVVVCPGARCAPMVDAIAQMTHCRRVVAHDERCGGFVALGAARASGRGALVVTTSGTAVANLLPAAVEASRTRTPLLLLTADRPPELRDCGANQTISQQRIFGEFARWELDMPCPDENISLEWLLSTIDEAWSRAHGLQGPAGPVHLNWMFREPLAPSVARWDPGILNPIARWLASRQVWRKSTLIAPSANATVESAISAIRSASTPAARPIVCVGAISSRPLREFARAVGAGLGWPVVADIASGIRHGSNIPNLVAHADLVVLSGRMKQRLMPDFIVRMGGVLTSRRISEFLATARDEGAQELVVRDGPERVDSEHGAGIELAVGPLDGGFDARNWAGKKTVPTSPILTDWTRAESCATNWLTTHLDSPSRQLDEPAVSRGVCRCCPDGTTLVIGNSMAIRDAEMHASASERDVTVSANRGASGIDGLVATALGHALATGKPTWLQLGDLSLLHDIGSLALVGASQVPLVIVVVNNDGGGIFHFLPLAAHSSMLEPWTTAPHGVRFEHAAKMFGLGYCALDSGATNVELERALAGAQESANRQAKSTLIEVTTNRHANVDVHRTIQSAIAKQLDDIAVELGQSTQGKEGCR